MGQTRNVSGVKFENLICEQMGWLKKSPKLTPNWEGKGRTNWDKIKNIHLNPKEFKLNLEKSKLEKYDAITPDGDKVEIKDYDYKDVKKWTLYSEPIIKVGTKKTMERVIEIFGFGDYDTSVEQYNNFIKELYPNFEHELLIRIVSSNSGIRLRDTFVPKEKLQFRWFLRENCWKGYNRWEIQFRVIE